MIRHLLKLVWNRKRATALLVVEITAAFLVLFSVVTGATFFLSNYTKPVGFSYENVWVIKVDMKVSEDKWTAEQSARMGNLLREAKSIDGVENAAVGLFSPYDSGGLKNGNWKFRGRDVALEFNQVTDDYADTLGLKLIRGRWFEKGDDAQNWSPVVIDADTAHAMFGQEDPIGQWFDKEVEPPTRIVGVVEEFRQGGELVSDTNYVFDRTRLGDVKNRPGRNLFVKLRPGTTPDFEEVLQHRLAPVAADWSLEIRPLSEMRSSVQRLQMAPIVIGSVIAGFLILMVALGLSGVLWQNVTQRRGELGLRRAIGASGANVRRQVMTELLLIAAFGILLGSMLIIQLPILGILSEFSIPLSVFATGFVLSTALMLLLTGACGLYPSWMATRIEPAEALRDE